MKSGIKRVAHLSVMRHLHPGIGEQTAMEARVAKNLDNIEWQTVVVHDAPPTAPHQRQTPPLFRAMFIRNLYAWILAVSLSRKVDVLFMRAIPFDPFIFIFAPFIKNRIPIHHAKEVEELRMIRIGLSGMLAANLERLTGWFSALTAHKIVGVTQEIATYQNNRIGGEKQTIVYPNGFEIRPDQILKDERDLTKLNWLFSCSTFAQWHGLDRLLDALKAYYSTPRDQYQDITLHLVGALTDQQIEQIENCVVLKSHVKIHGILPDGIPKNDLLSCCDMGFASLAIDRKNLSEASTLKVREMLAAGVPVFSNHIDAGFKADFPYFCLSASLDVLTMVNFSFEMKSVSKQKILEQAAVNISKIQLMKRLVLDANS